MHSFSQSAERILSLDMCSDWMLAKHVDRSRVIALSPFIHQYPVKWIGKRWPVHDSRLETILALKPDLVIVGEFNAWMLRERLSKLGIGVVVLPLPKTLSEIIAYEKEFLSAVGLPESLAHTALPASKNIQRKKLLLLGANGIGTGRGTLENDVLYHAGWDNYLQDKGYLSLDLEQLVLEKPDAILWAAPRSAALANQFAEHPVLKTILRSEQWLQSNYWQWQCPGPWTWQLVGKLNQWKD